MGTMQEENGIVMSIKRLNGQTISLATLATLIGILITAVGSWYTYTGQVKALTDDLSQLRTALHGVRTELKEANIKRERAVQSLRTRNETLTEVLQNSTRNTVERLAIVETGMKAQQKSLDNLVDQQKEVMRGVNSLLRSFGGQVGSN